MHLPQRDQRNHCEQRQQLLLCHPQQFDASGPRRCHDTQPAPNTRHCLGHLSHDRKKICVQWSGLVHRSEQDWNNPNRRENVNGNACVGVPQMQTLRRLTAEPVSLPPSDLKTDGLQQLRSEKRSANLTKKPSLSNESSTSSRACFQSSLSINQVQIHTTIQTNDTSNQTLPARRSRVNKSGGQCR